MAWSGIGQLSLEDENYIMLAAIDFGTTFSGYAFSFKTSPKDIKMNKNWGESLGFQSYKSPTSVLVDPRGQFVAFGFDAEQKYSELVEDDKGQAGHQMFRHFKMMLHKSGLSRHSKIQSTAGVPRDAMDIFAMALKYLKGHLLDVVAKQTAKPPSDAMIKWVITVPAIWTDEAKQFMREAAYKAELIRTPDSRKLVIALEPEAASIYCRSLDTDHFVVGHSVKAAGFGSGVKYLVIDAGGGTIDITAHEVLQNGQVKELHAANGGAWGGTKVDDNFINLMKEVLGEKFINMYRKDCPHQWLNLMTSFERAKKAAQPDGQSKIIIPLGWDMGSKYGEVMGKNIEQVIKAASYTGVSFASGSLIIKPEAVTKLFNPIMKEIVKHINALLKKPELKNMKYFLLVGGFGECAFLQRTIDDNFGSKVTLLVPFEAQMSVIKGAVLFGHRPTDISSRIAKKTYGYSHGATFDPKIHDIKHKSVVDGVEKCNNLFSVMIQKGESVKTGHNLSRALTASTPDQTTGTIRIFAVDRECSTDTSKPEYIVGSGFKQLGSVEVEMPDITGGTERKVNMEIMFGGTEIQVEATDCTSGNTAHTIIDFLIE